MKSLKQYLQELFFNEKLVINKNFKLDDFEDILRNYSWSSHLYTINTKDRNAFKDIIDYIKRSGEKISFNKMNVLADEGEYVCGFNEVIEKLFLVHRLKKNDNYVKLYDTIQIKYFDDVTIQKKKKKMTKEIMLFKKFSLECTGTEANYFIINKETFDLLKDIFNEIHH